MVDAPHDVNLAHRKLDLVLAIGPDFWQDFHGGLMRGSFPDEWSFRWVIGAVWNRNARGQEHCGRWDSVDSLPITGLKSVQQLIRAFGVGQPERKMNGWMDGWKMTHGWANEWMDSSCHRQEVFSQEWEAASTISPVFLLITGRTTPYFPLPSSEFSIS
jgi:hypothetical protein